MKQKLNFSPKVLIVDDDTDLRESIAELLSNYGCKVFEAQDGVEAIEQFKKTSPDFTLMDICMPKMDGISAVEKICTERNPNAKIVFMSGINEQQKIASYNFKCVVEYMNKPIRSSELLDLFNRYAVLKINF